MGPGTPQTPRDSAGVHSTASGITSTPPSIPRASSPGSQLRLFSPASTHRVLENLSFHPRDVATAGFALRPPRCLHWHLLLLLHLVHWCPFHIPRPSPVTSGPRGKVGWRSKEDVKSMDTGCMMGLGDVGHSETSDVLTPNLGWPPGERREGHLSLD